MAPTSGRPCGSQDSTATPSTRACSSERYTGSHGTGPRKGPAMSVPPLTEPSQMSGPSSAYTQSKPAGERAEPVDPSAVRAARSRPSRGCTPAFMHETT